MASTMASEQEAQDHWRLKDPANTQIIENLLRHEFIDPLLAAQMEASQLKRMLSFAKNQVPYYDSQDMWSRIDLDEPISRHDLAQLPVLTKHDLQENFANLKAQNLPNGSSVFTETSSSGTTGRPTKVLYSRHAALMFGILAQRYLRWARYDPQWTQASIVNSRDIPVQPGGEYLDVGQTYRGRGWTYIEHWFNTGPSVAFSKDNSVDAQMEWLHKERPQTLVCAPEVLETLVYAGQGKPVDSLRAVRTIASTLTSGMRKRIESATGLNVCQAYGLNEIGIVASRCAGERYHANAEHCVVEIVDENGVPCAPGETGRILVTGLTNLAMPLIRYNSGDVAKAVEGPCPCGRTLPSFGDILGRYRPINHAPEGTTRRVNLIQGTISELPLETLSELRECQVHQYIDGSFELRLQTRNEPDKKITKAIRDAWAAQAGQAPPLNIVRVGKIQTSPSGKQQDFTSDFFPAADEDI